MKSSVLLLTAALASVTLVSALKDVPKLKTGSCPAPEGFGICVIECSSDRDCEDALKCCSNGCGKTCQQPVFIASKPGSCPAPDNYLTVCDDDCSSDTDCDGNLKCCYSGCGYKCTCPEFV